MEQLETFIEETGYPREIVLKFLKNKKNDISELYCKCGKPKKLVRSSQAFLGWKFSGNCGSKECHPGYGKKRPEHSSFMKALAASGCNPDFSKTLMKKEELFNPEVNSISFKRKKLHNKGYKVEGLTDDDIISLEKQYEHDKQFTNESIAKKIVKFINKHNAADLFEYNTYDDLVKLSNDDLLKLRRRVYSYHHLIYCSETCVAKHFKRVEKTDLKYNMRNMTYVKTRSSYESNYIDFFESNGIKWDYEPFRLSIENEFYVSYTPDFIIEYDNKKYMLEVKGYILDSELSMYLKYKINYAYFYVENSDEYAGFIFTYEPKPKSIQSMINNYMLKEKF